MADNIQRSGGQAAGYKFDRGGVPAEFGPYIGEVKNNVDPIRAGRLQVYIEQLSGTILPTLRCGARSATSLLSTA